VRRLRAALLGATGAVGQRYVSMLAAHPSISLEVLMGKESAGKRYGESVRWLSPGPIPERLASSVVTQATPRSAEGCDVVFSALPADAARTTESAFARAGMTVVSEASAHRMDEDVPLLVPEVNPQHLKLLDVQRKKRGWKGCIVTTPNCTVTGLALVMKPLQERFGYQKAVVTTMQAVSGAGYPGVSSLLILENVIPFIRDEEEKVASESRKILGTFDGRRVRESEIPMGVTCNRVPVLEGHTETLYSEFSQPVSPEEATDALERFSGVPQRMRLHTAPERPIIVMNEPERPQPRLDRLAGSVPGMSVVVGRVRRGVDASSILLTLLSHNTIRGAAGTAILTAELMAREGHIRG
jgi:aspartate-semialdehyde dehydrogenase